MSGIGHEWIADVLVHNQTKSQRSRVYQTLFFTWMGVLVVTENVMLKFKLHPLMLRCIQLLLVGLTVHWYFDDFIHSGYFHDAQLGFPTLIFEDIQ